MTDAEPIEGPSTDYVTRAAWARPDGRPELIDEIADAFERPSGAEAYWSADAEARWPRRPQGWRSRDLHSHQRFERRAG